MMSDYRAALALGMVLSALVGDWVVSEMFPTRDILWDIVSVLTLNALALAGVVVAIRQFGGRLLVTQSLRIAAIFGFLGLLLISFRSATHPSAALGFATRLALVALVFAGALACVYRLGDALNDRLMLAIGLASVAFLSVPIAAKLLAPAPREWIGTSSSPMRSDESAPRRATLFLLLDELGYAAAAPLANDLQRAGLEVQYSALIPAGKDTQNVVPAMFSGFDFTNVRVCGMSAMCSDLNILDFSALRVWRPDVHVIGQHFPYCDIRGLQSCFQVQLPHSFGSTYKSFLGFFLKRLGVRTPAFLAQATSPPDHQRRLLQKQTRFIDQSGFWHEGGVMYAHLFMPHPPGLDGLTTLDGDYAANIEVSRGLVASYASRLKQAFGSNYSIVLTADHPLRTYWCNTEWYGADRCTVRQEFKDDKVPLIVAAPAPLRRAQITQNRDVFQVLNQQAEP